MKNLKELEQKYLELGKEIEVLKKQNTEEEEIAYPIYCKHINSSLVIKFTELHKGEVVINDKHEYVGCKKNDWWKCTDTRFWQQLDVCEKTGFFDGQLVWCWYNTDSHIRYLKFYDVKNEHYKPFEGNYPDWALEAFQTLER